MSTGLDQALEGIEIPQATGEGDQPDSPGSAAPETQPPAAGEGEGQPVGDASSGEEKPAGEKSTEEILAELTAASEPQAGDTNTIKELRALLKTRVDNFKQEDPGQSGDVTTLSDSDRDALEMVQGLFQYDLEHDRPTTKPFVDRLAQRDHTLVGQLLQDAINVPVPNAQVQNWTYGHELLQQMGLDPMKFPDLVRFSRGEIGVEMFGGEAVPEYVPQEYQEAYKQLNPVIRTDVDLYLRSDDPNQKAAAMQTLQDKYRVLEDARLNTERTATDTQRFNTLVSQEVETQVEQTYSNLLDTIGTNKAFVDVKVHSDPNVDSLVKNTIVNQICALGDDNAVLAKRAVESFKQMGVEVDIDKVNATLDSIKTNTEIAVRAQKQAERNGLKSSPQAEAAKQAVSKAVGEAVGMANRIAGEALKKYSPPSVVKDVPKDPEPNFRGGQQGPSDRGSTGNGAMTPQELDALIMNTTKTLREAGA